MSNNGYLYEFDLNTKKIIYKYKGKEESLGFLYQIKGNNQSLITLGTKGIITLLKP